MCGIIGVVAHTPVNQLLYDGLLLLQHRGQDAAGIVTGEGKMFHMHKGSGLVRDVFRTRNMRELLRHARHRATAATRPRARRCREPRRSRSTSTRRSASCSAHNGNLTNSRAAQARAVPARPAPRQHQLRLGGAAQRARARARAAPRITPRLDADDHLHRGRRRAPPLPRRLRGGRDDRRLRRARLPRSVRHPAAGHRRQRERGRHRVRGRLRVGGARRARLHGAARRRAGRGDLHRPGRQLPQPAVRRARRRSTPASSSTSTSRGPIR